MSVSKNKGTNLLRRSEKSSLRRFLALYFTLVVMILSLLGTFYYQSKEKLMYSDQRTILSNYAHEQIQQLRRLHRDFPQKSDYPRSSEFRSAIYDIERSKIFSTLKHPEVNFDKELHHQGGMITSVTYLDDYYLGTKYLFIEIDEDKDWYSGVMMEIFTLGTIILVVLAIFGLFFVNLFLRPMKNSIMLLDDFIKDTTHELNTPITALLMSVNKKNPTTLNNIRRINLSAKRISELYTDLTYLFLEDKNDVEIDNLNLKDILNENIDYFIQLAVKKYITLNIDTKDMYAKIDKESFIRLSNNLISNAIKYSKQKGTINITLKDKKFIVQDDGIGIDEDKQKEIFQRFYRATSNAGGFGIGLDIVSNICTKYDIKIDLISKKNQGSTFILSF